MSFLKNLVKGFGSQPLLLKMMPTDGGIKTGVFRNGQLLSPAELLSPKLVKQLPEPIVQLISSNPPIKDGAYLLPYPVAKKLIHLLKNSHTEMFQWDVASVAQLEEVQRPANFRIRWHYDPQQKVLARNFSHAQAYLGTGWFKQDHQVWLLEKNLSEFFLRWLSPEYIPESHIFQFVDEILLAYTTLPLECDLTIQRDFTVSLKIIRMLKHSLEIQAVASHPQLVADLKGLDGDARNMISGRVLLPNLATFMTPLLLQMLKSGRPLSLTKEDIPKFIQDEIQPHQDKLTVDIKALSEAFPMISANEMQPFWKLEHKFHQGIGVYQAAPVLRWKDQIFTIDEVITLAKKRFLALEEGWLVFDQPFIDNMIARINKGFKEFTLSHREVLGVPSTRFQATELPIPQVKFQRGFTEQENAYHFLDTMREAGLPAAISGLQMDIPRIISNLWSQHFQEVRQPCLWIVSQSKKSIVVDILRKAGASGTMFVVATPNEITPALTAQDWNIIIFQDCDVLTSNANHARLYSQLKRRWSIATLAKNNWNQAPQRTTAVLGALQLYLQDYELFAAKCLQVYSEQNEGLLSKLSSPFRKIFTAGTEQDAGSVPIPPRKVSPAPVINQPLNTKDVYRPKLDVRMPTHFTSPGENFITQAKRYADRIEGKTEPVPFMHYYPTYEEMTPSQQRWYFYWRSQLRQGEFLPTDTSYLFVHIYEVINLIGFDAATTAFEHLVAFWKHYRVLQPKLDRYLVDWIADFCAVHQLSVKPLQWYGQAIAAGATSGDLDLIVEAWIQNGAHFEQLPSELIYRLAGYSPGKSKFYQQYNINQQIDAGYRKGLQAVNAYSLEKTRQSLLDCYRTPEARVIKRIPFANALHDLTANEIELGRVHLWTTNSLLAKHLNMIIKYTENHLRQQFKFKSKLRGIEIEPSWATAIDQIFAPIPSKPGVVIDLENVANLQRETQEIRQRLTVEDSPEIVLDMDSIANLQRDTQEIRQRLTVDEESNTTEELATVALPVSLDTSLQIVRPADTPVGLLTDLEPVQIIMGYGDTINTQILQILHAQDWQAEATKLQAILTDGQFLNVVLDELNEVANEQLGCSLVIEENGVWVVEEDYRDEVEFLLKQPDVSVPTLSMPIGATVSPTYNDLTSEWSDFAKKMQPQHWEALTVLVLNVDVLPRLDAIARSIYSTANQLIDEINEFALECIGDIVIDTTNDLPQIEEEDIEGLAALLEWAKSNTVLEM